jgi:hypothetical protein
MRGLRIIDSYSRFRFLGWAEGAWRRESNRERERD